MSGPMTSTDRSAAAVPPSGRARPTGFALLFHWRRVRFVLLVSLIPGLLVAIGSATPAYIWAIRAILTGLFAMAGFGLAEQWPRRLPRWLARWVLQLLSMCIAAPIGAYVAYWVTVLGNPQFIANPQRFVGFAQLTFSAIAFGLLFALGALVRQREALARDQAHAFELERSEYARQALDAKMRLLQAQVQPHFLFNTLANVQALVDAGSPHASKVLRSLTAYLRAAVPRLNESDSTFDRELQLVRAYLELMHIRMPDRLRYSVNADAGVLPMRCPAMTLLTLVENAVQHGIDPSEEGGHIDITVVLINDRCRVTVSDTGVGLRRAGDGLGTGLSTLRERLQLAFDGKAELRLSAGDPQGTVAELDFPADAGVDSRLRGNDMARGNDMSGGGDTTHGART